MLHAIVWLVIGGLFILGSLSAWALHAVVDWTVANMGVLAAGAGVTPESLRLPAWIAPWIPPELVSALTSLASALAPAIETFVGWAPALGGGLTVVVWAAWALGTVLLVVLGIAASAFIALFKGRRAGERIASTMSGLTRQAGRYVRR